MMDMRQRYETDVQWRHVVDILIRAMEEGYMTQLDIAKAAQMAAQVHGERHRIAILIRVEEANQ